MLLSKTVKIKAGVNAKYYQNLGYTIPIKDACERTKRQKHIDYVLDIHKELEVKVEDLPIQSPAKVKISCDICGEEFYRSWANYNRSIELHGIVVCKKHRYILQQRTNLNKYGTLTASQSEIVKEKARKTNQERYGVDYYTQTEEFKEKSKETSMERYGVENASQAKEVCEKRSATILERYGVQHISQSPQIQEKKRQTNRKIYGVDNPSQNETVRTKIVQSFYYNSSIKTSRPQIYINNLYGMFYHTELNYPIKYYNGDIVDLDNKIDIEINFGGHYIPVVSGKVSEKEYQEREMRRGCCVIDNGYKLIRIISRYDYIPSDDIMLDMYILAMDLFDNGWNWIDFDIDNKIYRYAEFKEGIGYNYGQLYRIKKGRPIDDIQLIPIKKKL